MEPSSRQEARGVELGDDDSLTPHPTPNTTRLIILMGLPGSGKTTLAQYLLTASPERRLISTDAIRAQLFGDEAVQGPWWQIWREVQHQLQQGIKDISQGQIPDAIYDATNTARKQRRRVLTLARSLSFQEIVGFWLDLPLEVCLARNRQRDRVVPEAVMLRMHRQLLGAPPALEEGFTSLIRQSWHQ
ncbi:AAA family ATPase [Trichocoleus desertorum AS-A10]|uniref:AAA family ATPase n=1 Tax=Trichocoleus desertorum TaxID=1481672 RepID=UPI0032981B2A